MNLAFNVTRVFIAAFWSWFLVEARGQENLIAIDFQNGHPHLRWSSTNGAAFQLLINEEIAGNATRRLTITSDAREIRWIDESMEAANSAHRFYRWQVRPGNPAESRWQRVLNQVRGSAGVPGAAAAIITTNGVWVGTSGFSDLKAKTQIEPQMRFCIGSISKSFVAAAVLQLADEGKLDLDDPLSKWLPDHPNITNSITIRQMLDHTSGISDYFDSYEWEARVFTRPSEPLDFEELAGYIGKPYFPPGTSFHYSNTGYLLLGSIVEKVSGRTVMEEYRNRFIHPLELTSIYLRHAEDPTGPSPHPYSVFHPGRTEIDSSSIPDAAYFSCIWTAGGLFATVEDTARWIHALWSGSIHSLTSYRDMISWNPVGGAEKYGLGVWSQTTSRGEFYVHSGHVPGFRSYAGYSPTLKSTIVLFFNSERPILPGWLGLVNAL